MKTKKEIQEWLEEAKKKYEDGPRDQEWEDLRGIIFALEWVLEIPPDKQTV